MDKKVETSTIENVLLRQYPSSSWLEGWSRIVKIKEPIGLSVQRSVNKLDKQ